MQEQTRFSLSDTALAALRSRNAIKETLWAEFKANIKVVEDLLVGYHFRERGSVNDLVIEENSLLTDRDGNGYFIATYVLGMFNACADLDLSDTARMKIDFKTDLEGAEVLLTGEYFPEREPDEF